MLGTLRQVLNESGPIPAEIAERLLPIIEGEHVCGRLDVPLFSVLAEILIRSPPSVAQERGLYLLMVKLHGSSVQTSSSPRSEIDAEQPISVHAEPDIAACHGGSSKRTQVEDWVADTEYFAGVLCRY